MSAYTDALAQLAILTPITGASPVAPIVAAITALQTAVGQMLPTDQATLSANASYKDLTDPTKLATVQAGNLNDADLTTALQGYAADAAALTTIINGMIVPPSSVSSSTGTIVLAAAGGLLVGMLLLSLARRAGL